ncbi:PREDICTED: protein TONNEAU 1b-like [Nelumbo nucifera]|uniref:Protein TONNEAU 1b-like n=1 Tax=Nelumbo nucifera TaxID=4432 RepID=A0A1U8Q3X8_NELNU|nr:PREDICTED: protein TONNEAU 1b-like [Nelumbo nucifera]
MEERAGGKNTGFIPDMPVLMYQMVFEFLTHKDGRLLTALACEYLDWAQLGHTLKVYLPECNMQKDFWKAELKDFCSKNGYDFNRNRESGPLLLDVLEGYLKYEV